MFVISICLQTKSTNLDLGKWSLPRPGPCINELHAHGTFSMSDAHEDSHEEDISALNLTGKFNR